MPFLCFLLYLSLTYVRPYELYPGLAPYRLMLVVGSVGLFVCFFSIPISRFTFRAKQLPVAIAFALWTAVSLVLALRWFGGALQALNEFGITLIAFFLAVFSVNSERRLRIALVLLVVLSLFLVFQSVAALQFGHFRELLVMEQKTDLGQTVLRIRGTGFMRDPNDLAQSLLTAIPFAALGWRRRAVLRNLFLVGVPTAILLYGVYLTGSRGGAVSLMVMIFVAVRPKLGNVLSGFMVAMGVLGLIAMSFGGRGFMDESAVNRLEAWSMGLQLLKSHPLSGVGYGMFTDFNPITAHNAFVLCFAELGIPGYFLWLALSVVTVLELNAIRRLPVKTESDVSLQRFARSIQISLYTFLAAGWFLSRTYVVTFYLLIALAISVAEIARRSGKTLGPFSYPYIATRTAMALAASIALIYLQVNLQVR
jgi:putative inorganic carbon (hco3(-)) transporter